jgi:hypothetical protein
MDTQEEYIQETFAFMDRPLCACGCKRFVMRNQRHKGWNKYLLGHYLKTPEAKRNSSEMMIRLNARQWSNDEFRAKMAKLNAVRWADEEHRCKISQGMSERNIQNWRNPQYQQAVARRTSEQMRRQWADPEMRQHMIENIIKMGNRSQNKLESLFDSLTPACVEYVGDGQLWYIWPNGRPKNPDFKVKNKPQVIELFGDYWHRYDDPMKHIEMWRRLECECLVIWESDFKTNREAVLGIVKDFIGM